MPRSAPGRPTLGRPVWIRDCPVMKAALPAVQEFYNQAVNSFFRDAIDVRCPVTHLAAMVDAWTIPANIIAHDDENVWFATRRCLSVAVGRLPFRAVRMLPNPIAWLDAPDKRNRRVSVPFCFPRKACICVAPDWRDLIDHKRSPGLLANRDVRFPGLIQGRALKLTADFPRRGGPTSVTARFHCRAWTERVALWREVPRGRPRGLAQQYVQLKPHVEARR